MDIDILCKVVDNYGDIGIAYRLARALSELSDPIRLRLVVDDLAAFAALDPAVDPEADYQRVHDWEVFGWNGAGSEAARRAFLARRPRIVIESLACGRPDWLEAIIFDPSERASCLIVELEHLTAEGYAQEIHRMPSLTRSAFVKKVMFLPGFAAGTGGLIMDGGFVRSRERAASDAGRAGLRRELLASLEASAAAEDACGRFWVCVFGYERDYGRIVADLSTFAQSRPILVLAAAGKSSDCLLSAWSSAGESFPLVPLPFLPQERWDEVLLACDFSIVRGEDSWARASLSGKPFLWQAYPQDGRYQMVKVDAFLERLRPHFRAEPFDRLETLYCAFNDRERDGPAVTGEERLLPCLEAYEGLLRGFGTFAVSLSTRQNDLARDLVTFLGEIV
jgi:uncharacterized repeat protein (TIGR03837 family)